MSPSHKATLLSALVFPGAGQYILKRYYRATGLASVTLVTLYILLTSAIEKATAISDKILNGEIAPDITTISKAITDSAVASDATQTDLATVLLILAWLAAIIDAWFIGHSNKVSS